MDQRELANDDTAFAKIIALYSSSRFQALL